MAGALLVYLWHVTRFWHYVNDDAYITFRYSRFLATGRGPYFNPGEHVEGYTNFLWMLLLAPLHAIGGESALPVIAKVLCVLCGAAAIAAAFALVRALTPPDRARPWSSAAPAVVAAGLIAVSPGFTLNSTSGLETALFSAEITGGVLVGLLGLRRSRWLGSGVFFAAAALTRPEGVLLFLVFGLTLLVSGRHGPLGSEVDTRGTPSASAAGSLVHRTYLLRDAAVVFGAVLAHLVFRVIAYDGEWLPNTYYAKVGGFWALSAASYVREHVLLNFLGLIGLTTGLAGWFLAKRSRLAGLPVVAVGLTGALLPLVTGPDWMLGGRMVMPFVPLLAVVVGIGWCRLAESSIGRLASPLVALTALAVVGSWFYQGKERSEWREHTEMRARGYASGHMALANYLRGQAAKPGDTVAIMDIGLVGYLCDQQRILDITGLTDRHIAKSPGEFMDKQYEPSYILDRHPEFIVFVYHAQGNPTQSPQGSVVFGRWTDIENRLAVDPEFQRSYVNPRPVPPGSTWTEAMAAQIGAERIFEHLHPGLYYLLALYRRQD